MTASHAAKEDSVFRRYRFTLAGSAIGMVTGYVATGLAVRALGPIAYGNFGFLQNVFQSIVKLLNLNSSQAFQNLASRDAGRPGLVTWYSRFGAAMGLILAVGVAFLFGTGFASSLLPGQTFQYAALAAVLGFTQWASRVVSSFGDAKARTVLIQLVVMLVRVGALAGLVLMVASDLLNLTTYFLYQIGIFGLTAVGGAFLLRHHVGQAPPETISPTEGSRSTLTRYFADYCKPLVLMTVLASGYLIFDRWILQVGAGSEEQSFFTLGLKISTLGLLFTTAVVPVWFREVARTHGHGDTTRLREMFDQYVRLFYAFAAAVSVFLASHALDLIIVIAGEEYRGAAASVALLGLYPLHQTHSQLTARSCLPLSGRGSWHVSR
jgi:O-antigen/teichoic acid export membrane protein